MALASLFRISRNVGVRHQIKGITLLRSATSTTIEIREHTKVYEHRDWLHGPYPKTKEEREAAAKKYNLLPEDYKPFPEEYGYGDYPNLDIVCAEARDPHEPYDMAYLKRNYGEPLHFHFDLYRENMLNEEEVFDPPLYLQFIYVCLGYAAFFGLIHLGYRYPIKPSEIPLQYPKPGVKHYTFEPADS